ncbi:unnamed protein product [Symbiodinium sp. CCMP2592]|nr:unnamed protein product [Symbiodinium sp. CCMP2592]
MFAGHANLTYALRKLNFKVVNMDLSYGGKYNDLSSAAGMAFAGLAVAAVLRMEPAGLLLLAPVCSSFSDMCQAQAQRSIVTPLGNMHHDFVVNGNLLAHRFWVVSKCFNLTSHGQAGTCLHKSLFLFSSKSLSLSLSFPLSLSFLSLCLAAATIYTHPARCVLLCLLAAALGHVFLLEQPASAKIRFLPRFEELCDKLIVIWFLLIISFHSFDFSTSIASHMYHVVIKLRAALDQVFRQSIFMCAYGKENVKPTMIWSNSSLIQELQSDKALLKATCFSVVTVEYVGLYKFVS